MTVIDGTRSTAASIVGERDKRMLVDGQWVAAGSGEDFEVFDPSTADVIALVPAGDTVDVDRAVAAARRAFSTAPGGR